MIQHEQGHLGSVKVYALRDTGTLHSCEMSSFSSADTRVASLANMIVCPPSIESLVTFLNTPNGNIKGH